MKDEIKEILSNMLHIIVKYDDDDFDDFEENEIRYQLPYKQMEKLYDYITNLQEENEILKEINICVGCNNEKQEVIDKAIEYIENIKFAFDFDREINKFAFDLLYTEQGEKLLNILKGE